jgi:hypothetical protein
LAVVDSLGRRSGGDDVTHHLHLGRCDARTRCPVLLRRLPDAVAASARPSAWVDATPSTGGGPVAPWDLPPSRGILENLL